MSWTGKATIFKLSGHIPKYKPNNQTNLQPQSRRELCWALLPLDNYFT